MYRLIALTILLFASTVRANNENNQCLTVIANQANDLSFYYPANAAKEKPYYYAKMTHEEVDLSRLAAIDDNLTDINVTDGKPHHYQIKDVHQSKILYIIKAKSKRSDFSDSARIVPSANPPSSGTPLPVIATRGQPSNFLMPLPPESGNQTGVVSDISDASVCQYAINFETP